MLFLNISLATTPRGYVRQPKKNFGVKYVSCVSREGWDSFYVSARVMQTITCLLCQKRQIKRCRVSVVVCEKVITEKSETTPLSTRGVKQDLQLQLNYLLVKKSDLTESLCNVYFSNKIKEGWLNRGGNIFYFVQYFERRCPSSSGCYKNPLFGSVQLT